MELKPLQRPGESAGEPRHVVKQDDPRLKRAQTAMNLSQFGLTGPKLSERQLQGQRERMLRERVGRGVQAQYDKERADRDRFAPIPAPKRDPRIDALMKNQRELARRFRENMPDWMAGEFGEFTRDRSRALDEERQGIDASMNRRGLLRSGMTEGASMDAGQRATQDTLRKRVEIGDRYRGIADDLDNEPLQTEIALAGGQAQIGQAAQNASMSMQKLMMENRLQRQNLLEQAFEGGGAALGAFLGRPSSSAGYDSASTWASRSDGYNPFLDFHYGI